MNIAYKLTNSDFLAYQLYISSKSKSHEKKRLRSRILVPIFYIGFAVFLYVLNKKSMLPVIFAGIAFIWFLFYPFYSRWLYKRHFRKHIAQNYKNRINKENELSFGENAVLTTQAKSSSKIDESEIKALIETKDHFFIKLASDMSFIVPKTYVENQEGFKKEMTKLNVEYINEIDWEWK